MSPNKSDGRIRRHRTTGWVAVCGLLFLAGLFAAGEWQDIGIVSPESIFFDAAPQEAGLYVPPPQQESLDTDMLEGDYEISYDPNGGQGPGTYAIARSPDTRSNVSTWGFNEHAQLGEPAYLEGNPVPVDVSISDAIAIAGGEAHSIALRSDGTVWAWGDNAHGQLGSAPGGPSAWPVKVPLKAWDNTDLRAIAIAAGHNHSLAIIDNGDIWAWGDNRAGQLGDGTVLPRTGPVRVRELDNSYYSNGIQGMSQLPAIAVSAGKTSSMALTAAGTVCVWGRGDGSPKWFKPMNQVIAVASGEDHCLALRADGTIYAWGGKNAFGELGFSDPQGYGFGYVLDPDDSGRKLYGVKAIAAGRFHSVALKVDGTVMAWGSNSFAQLGQDPAIVQQSFRPLKILSPDFANIIEIAAGHEHTLGLRADGTVWGMGGGYQIGQERVGWYSNPVRMSEIQDAIAIAAGAYHSMSILCRQSVYAWGSNDRSELATGDLDQRSSPTLVEDLGIAKAVLAGSRCSFALCPDGTVWRWGALGWGKGSSTAPMQVKDAQGQPLKNVLSMSVQQDELIVLLADGNLFAAEYWGNGIHGLVPLQDSHRCKAVSAGQWGILELTADGLVYLGSDFDPGFWNFSYKASYVKAVAIGTAQLLLQSDGTVLEYDSFSGSFVKVPALGDRSESLVTAIAVPGDSWRKVVLTATGRVLSWGLGNLGELGNGEHEIPGDIVDHSSRTPVYSSRGKAISAGNHHTMALQGDGTLLAWGINYSGELGIGVDPDRNDPATLLRDRPEPVKGIRKVTAISAGYSHTLALSLE